jgi:hypothetical protein
MDTLGPILFYAVLGVVIFLAAGYLGFRIPAPLRWPYGEPVSEVQHQPVPAGLPTAARRWLSDTQGQMVAPDTLVAWGRGRIASKMPILGRVWLPLSWTMYLIPGSSFLIQNRITWFGRRFIRGGEEFRDGKGAFILGSDKMDAPYLDETERSLVWLYSLWLAPGSLINRDDVAMGENEDGSIRLAARTAGKPDLVFNLHFDPDTGGLSSINTFRKGSRSGDDYPYLTSLSRFKLINGEQTLPTSYTGDWDRDVYIKLELVGMQLNQDVSEAIQTGIADLSS